MKYTRPQLEIIKLETSDIITDSNGLGSISVGEITIIGPKDEFSYDFSDLLGEIEE